MTLGVIVLSIYAIAVLHMHFRGQVRFPATRQFLTHTNYLAPYNLLMDLFSKLPNKPILDVDSIGQLSLLRENWRLIRDEAMNLDDNGQIKAAERLNDAGFNSFFRRGWTRYYLKWYGDMLPSAQQACPITTALLARTPVVQAAMFACLPAGADLQAHRDPFAGSLRYHLGLVTPNSECCYIVVDGQRHVWLDGKDVLFDETFIHEAHNDSEQDRIILFCDVTRPLKFRVASRFNEFVCRTLMQATATQNDAGDRVGMVNQLFARAYTVRTWSKKLKHWNRSLYKVLKYGLFFVLIYWLFIS